MWRRNLLFIGLCAVGVGLLGSTLLSRNRIDHPAEFNPLRTKQSDFAATVARVDREFREHWQAAGLEHAERADELTIARRLSLGLTGTVPSLEELRSLEAVPTDQRQEWWLSRLLNDRRYADFVGERLARAYVGTENGPFLIYRRRRFVTWLSDRLDENTPYDQIIRDLISETGIWTTNPAVNFVTVTVDQDDTKQPDPIRLAARTTRAFLGMRIDCLQCHDNNLPEFFALGEDENVHDGLQDDFHQLAAFFVESRSQFNGIHDDKKRKYEFQYLYEDEPVVVTPRTPYLADLEVSGGSKRARLANWVTHKENKPFARAIVNRVWALMVGRPLLEPIDSIPLYGYSIADLDDVGPQVRWWSGSAPFPPGMEALAEDFVEHRYDLKRLIRLIAASEVYRLDSRAAFPIERDHELKWAVFPLSRLRPEQVSGRFDSSIVADYDRYQRPYHFAAYEVFSAEQLRPPLRRHGRR